MDEILKKKLEDAVWVAHSLFERGKTSGSSANMSFLHNGNVYITASGTCFGTLTEDTRRRRRPFRQVLNVSGLTISTCI